MTKNIHTVTNTGVEIKGEGLDGEVFRIYLFPCSPDSTYSVSFIDSNTREVISEATPRLNTLLYYRLKKNMSLFITCDGTGSMRFMN